VQADPFDEAEFFGSISRSGARALLIGRRAMVALGFPVLTADYDFWLHRDDIEIFNAALEPLELIPNHTPDQARARGRYVLENGEHVDVLVARAQSTVDGVSVDFGGVWERRRQLVYSPAVHIFVPSLRDLVLTKRWATRDRDVADIRMLENKIREEDA
jgi:hypothetical protein